jgi:hypothetical protein
MDTALRVLPYEARNLSVIDGLADYPAATPDMGAFERHSPMQNHILAALPDAEYERVRPYLDFVQLPLGMMLHETNGRSSFAYFPTAGIVSPLCMMQNGAAAAVAITGNDGMIGTSLFMGRGGTPDRAVVQSPGHGYRLGANRLRHEFDRGGYFSKLLLQYTHSLFMQMAQTAVCNRYHSIEQQLCRWLLMMMDRMPSNELSLTHELLSRILGVRREGITDAAGKLQKAGVIRYRRGHITVLDHRELQTRVCECYAVVNGESTRQTAKARRNTKLHVL